jgi:transcriptional regulator with XRE-family HTH domain
MIRAAREAQGLTWYALAKRAGIPNPNTVRDIEYGRDTKLSSVEAVAEALGLRLELVEVWTSPADQRTFAGLCRPCSEATEASSEAQSSGSREEESA